MDAREFHFSEGSSNKFWKISVEGTTQTVQYGRIGTAGQTATKEFDSAAAAKTASDKLIAEKVKKGYVEVAAFGIPASSAGDSSVEPIDAPLNPFELLPYERSIDLTYDDYVRVGISPRKPRKRPNASAFNLDDALLRFNLIKTNWWAWDFSPARISHSLSPAEAEFWLQAMTIMTYRSLSPAAVTRDLSKREYTGDVDLDSMGPQVRDIGRRVAPEVAIALANLGPARHIVDIIIGASNADLMRDEARNVLTGFELFVLPYLSTEEYNELADHVRSVVFDDCPTMNRIGLSVFYLAGLLGLRDELRPIVTAGMTYTEGSAFHISVDLCQHVALMLGCGDHVNLLGANLTISDQDMARYWLAITQYGGLDVITRRLIQADKDEAVKIARGLARVHAPEAAPEMLRVYLKSAVPTMALEWFNANPVHTVVGLMPIAAGNSDMATDAAAILFDLAKRGHRDLVKAGMASVSPDAADTLSPKVLPHVTDPGIPPLDDATTPAALAAATSEKLMLRPGDPTPADLPPIRLETPAGPRRLTDVQLVNLFASLQKSTLDAPQPYVAVVKSVVDGASLDAFGWAMFELWTEQGFPLKQKWWFYAVGLLGNDASVYKLTPLLNQWRMNGFATRAQQGLECLRAIGTDTALMQISNISQKAEFKSLRGAALACMDRIATTRGFTKAQLEDRIVPNCGLDERGSRTFEYGPRQFRFTLSPEMKPMLKDGDGKRYADLPNQTAKDDAALAETAAGEWKILKKQVAQVVKVQSARLEQAMVTGRRWSPEEFYMLILRHPLMTNLARLLLWGVYGDNGSLGGLFRVTEDQTLADVNDKDYRIPLGRTVGVAHPLHLTDAEKAVWGEMWSDYEMIPPFRQIGRPTYRLAPEETDALTLDRFSNRTLPAASVVFTLDKREWVRAPVGDGGVFSEHSKQFVGADVTAVISYQPGVMAGMISQSGSQKLHECYWLRGLPPPSEIWKNAAQQLRWGDVDPVVVSEVLADLTAIVAKAA